MCAHMLGACHTHERGSGTNKSVQEFTREPERQKNCSPPAPPGDRTSGSLDLNSGTLTSPTPHQSINSYNTVTKLPQTLHSTTLSSCSQVWYMPSTARWKLSKRNFQYRARRSTLFFLGPRSKLGDLVSSDMDWWRWGWSRGGVLPEPDWELVLSVRRLFFTHWRFCLPGPQQSLPLVSGVEWNVPRKTNLNHGKIIMDCEYVSLHHLPW